MNKQETIQKMNDLGNHKKPFFFMIDYKMENCICCSLNETITNGILFKFNDQLNYTEHTNSEESIKLIPKHIPYNTYSKAFNDVKKELNRGNTYLVNLTFSTPIQTDASLYQIFHSSKARYKILFQDKFVVFSPESFIRITDQTIKTYPMKGTIDASEENAEEKLLNNHKEHAEHATIVDLLRNDLSLFSKEVKVNQFRYVEKIETQNKDLLQVSSEISGVLPSEFNAQIGTIIFSMLPAGSVTGAPKPKTLEIINKVETHKRNYYTGIAGIFDGNKLDSCVLIRYIEKEDDQYYFKSGGGITAMSDPESEFNELKDKIYVPIG